MRTETTTRQPSAQPSEPPSKRERQKARRAQRLEVEHVQQQRANVRRIALRVLAVIVGVAVFVGLVVLGLRSTDVTRGVEPATVSGESLAVPPEAGADPAIGQAAPVADGFDFDGQPVSIGDGDGPQAVLFLAHWCTYCMEELPLVAEWVDAGLLPDEVELVAVSTRHDPARPNWPPDAWLDREAFPGAVLVDGDEAVATSWGLGGTPMWVFTDADGTVVARQSGRISPETFTEAAALAAGTAS